jgi:hypothetical protein
MRIAQPRNVAEVTSSHSSAGPENSSRQIGPAISHQPTSEGETKAESDHHLGKSIVAHRSTLIRYPAGTMARPRQKNVAGMN